MSNNTRKYLRKAEGTTALELTALAVAILTTGAEKFVDNVDNIDNAPFDSRTRERDTFLADALHDSKFVVKDAAALVATRMQGCDKQIVAKTIDTLCYSVLKSAMFDVFVAHRSGLARREGAVPDSFFAQYNRAPAAENCEVDAEDVKDFPADQREEQMTAPPGLAANHETLMTVLGVKLDGDLDDIAPQVAVALDDARIHLENIRVGYGYKGQDRLPFFVDQIGGEWVRHTGSPYEALLAFEAKLDASRRRKDAQAEATFARNNAERRAAA